MTDGELFDQQLIQVREIREALNETKQAIFTRAQKAFTEQGIFRDKIDIAMDLEAANMEHALRWEDLLAADKYNFTHDIFGIYRHLNRQTCKLENCFVPRFTK